MGLHPLLPKKKINLTENKNKLLRFGICADIHKDVIHDADVRLSSFIEEAQKKELDFINSIR